MIATDKPKPTYAVTCSRCGYLRTRVYVTRGRVQYCKCPSCKHHWKQLR